MVQSAGLPIHINPHVGRLSGQAKPNEARRLQELSWALATSVRGNQLEQPRSPLQPILTDVLSLGPH
jgi:hypothetical protein